MNIREGAGGRPTTTENGAFEEVGGGHPIKKKHRGEEIRKTRGQT